MWWMLMLWLAAGSSQAGEPDFSLGTAARSVPFGAALYGDLGYQELLWGEKGEGQYFYGYVRPALKFRTSGVVHRVEPALSVYPVSFIGFHASYGQSYRATTLDTLDCGLLECGGGLTRLSGGFSWMMGHAGFFATGSTTLTGLQPSRTERDFGDESSSLAGSRAGDRLLSNEVIAGYELSPEWKAGAWAYWDHMNRTNTGSQLLSLFGRWERAQWTTTVGAGTYESTTAARGLTVYGLVRWAPKL